MQLAWRRQNIFFKICNFISFYTVNPSFLLRCLPIWTENDVVRFLWKWPFVFTHANFFVCFLVLVIIEDKYYYIKITKKWIHYFTENVLIKIHAQTICGYFHSKIKKSHSNGERNSKSRSISHELVLFSSMFLYHPSLLPSLIIHMICCLLLSSSVCASL